jgi:hypothetical protein
MSTVGMPSAAISKPASGSNISAPAPMMPCVTWICVVRRRPASPSTCTHPTATGGQRTSARFPAGSHCPTAQPSPENTISTPAIDSAIPVQRSADACSRSHTTGDQRRHRWNAALNQRACDADVYTSE